MIYKSLKILFPLSRYVDSIYYFSAEGNSFTKNIIPDGKTDIVFNLNSNEIGFYKNEKKLYSNKSVIQGLRKRNFNYFSKEKICIAGIRLMPYGLFTLFNVRSSDISEDPVELNLVLGKNINELEEKLFDAKEIEDKFRLLQNWLFSFFIKREERNGMLIDAIHKIYNSQGKSQINNVCKNYNYYKKIQRSFHDAIGISPKLYARMVRFESLHNDLLNTDKIDWMNIVSKYNFFDQSHLSKEFQFFTGHSPQEFVYRINNFV